MNYIEEKTKHLGSNITCVLVYSIATNTGVLSQNIIALSNITEENKFT